MSDNTFDNIIDNGEFSVDAILAEYTAKDKLYPNGQGVFESDSRPIITQAEGDIGDVEILSSLPEKEPHFSEASAEDIGDEPSMQFVYHRNEAAPSSVSVGDPFSDDDDVKVYKPSKSFDTFEKSDSVPHPSATEAPPGEGDDIWQQQGLDYGDNEQYAPAGKYEDQANEYSSEEDRRVRQPDFLEKVIGPVVGLIAAASVKRNQRQRAESERRRDTFKKLPPELSPERAAAFYAAQASSLRMRCFFATAISIILVYLSFGLPAAGALGSSPTLRSFMCLVLLLVVTLIGLDIFTNGIVSLLNSKPGAETLISVSCIVSALDAALIAATRNIAVGLPFCAVSALSMTFALWGSYLNCDSFARSMNTAAKAHDPSVVISKAGGEDGGGCVLSKAKRPLTGFVRQTEQADIFETVYRYLTPVLLVACVVLSLFCVLASKENKELVHTLSACTSVCASFSAVFGFALPLSVLTRRLSRSGVAVAGFAGCAELGRIRRVMVNDTDVFPQRTVSIADIAISEAEDPKKIISYAASMVSAAGMGIAPLFTELMRKNGCMMATVEDFACHEGGGVLARINGDTVYVGCSSFMRLMGVRIPKSASSATAVFVAVNDALSGIFSIDYKPVGSVQRALVSLLRKRVEPVFAVRDFSITPMLIKQKFRLPKDSFDFPSFAERYRISSQEAEDNGTVCAMFARGGLNAVAGLAERGRKLYYGSFVCAALSVLCGVVGMVLMLSLCWTGAFDSASCANVMTYMLLWLVPSIVISLGLRN